MARTTRGAQPSVITENMIVVENIMYAIKNHMTPARREAEGAVDCAMAERKIGVADQMWIKDPEGNSHVILAFIDGTYSPVY